MGDRKVSVITGATGGIGARVVRKFYENGYDVVMLDIKEEALAALAEWVGLQLNGREDLPKAALQVVKCADYILTPTATGALVMQMHRNSRRSWLLTGVLAGLLALNAVFQIISAFFGLTVVIDSHHVYSKGPLYPAYLALCMIVILMVITVFFSI